MQKLPSVGLFVGFLLLFGSALIGFVIFPKIIQGKISEQIKLVNGSETFERWRDVPVPIYMKFHLFNVTNPFEVISGGKPKFEEVGPFTFRQRRKKVDISENSENDTLTYRQLMTYFYEPEMSKGSLTDVVTMINLPYLGMAHKASKQSVFVRSLLLQLIEPFEEKLFIQRTVDEMLFKGYYVDMMESMSGFLGYKLLPNDTFGLYYGKNGSDQGIYEIYSGVKDPLKFGQVVSWNGSPEMPWWEDETCKKVHGSDGSIFPPFVDPEQKVNLFSADLCRVLKLSFNKDSDVHGIPSYRYTVDHTELEDPVFNRDNMCYCTQPGTRFDNCPKQGAYQINACRKETPLLVSLPHFLDASEDYFNKTEGLHPDRSLHETFIELEPTSGLLLKASKRIQMNIELRRFSFIKQLKKVPSMLFPIVWVDESAEMPEAGRGRLQSKLIQPQHYAKMGSWIGCALGLLIIIIATLVYLMRARKKPYN